MANAENRSSLKSELFEGVLDNLPTPVLVKDKDLRFVFANKAFVQRAGMPFEDIVGKSDKELFPEDQVAAFMARDQQIMNTGETNYTEERNIDHDGVERVWATTKARFVTEDGSSYLIGGQVDITSERNQQENLKAAAQETETVIDLLRELKILSLNAAIEAARFGERGAGFAVLASAMRGLAEKTDLAAKRIKSSAY